MLGDDKLAGRNSANDFPRPPLHEELHGGEEPGQQSEDAAGRFAAPSSTPERRRSRAVDKQQEHPGNAAVDRPEASPQAQNGSQLMTGAGLKGTAEKTNATTDEHR